MGSELGLSNRHHAVQVVVKILKVLIGRINRNGLSSERIDLILQASNTARNTERCNGNAAIGKNQNQSVVNGIIGRQMHVVVIRCCSRCNSICPMQQLEWRVCARLLSSDESVPPSWISGIESGLVCMHAGTRNINEVVVQLGFQYAD